VAVLGLEQLGKTYADGTVAVRGVDLAIDEGELVVLVGPSGCGKTTILRMVAGLEDITDGAVTIDGRVVNDLNEADRDIAMVFQNYALYPHLTVRQNIAFPLRLAKVAKQERARRVEEAARTLGLLAHLDQRPGQLSGGQRQRVAMGRAIVREPQVFLMDEPLSNLDAKLRVQMRAQILELQQRLGITTMYVTHDQAEAMTLGTRVAVLRDGTLQQLGTPADVYRYPCNLFVASFLGSPAMSLLLGRLEHSDGAASAVIGVSRLQLDAIEASEHARLRARGGSRVVAGIRPEAVRLAEEGDSPTRLLSGRVLLAESLGSDLLAHVRIDGADALPSDLRLLALEPADATEAEEGLMGSGATLSARLPMNATVRRGDPVRVTVEPGGLTLFDSSTGESLRTP
jgi:multiple sugar transport system ATP-binding protein